MQALKIVLIGTGAVAEQLTVGLSRDLRYIFSQIYGRSTDRLTVLLNRITQHCGIKAISSLEEIDRDADIYLFSITDDALPTVWASMPTTGGLWLHTAGSVPLSAMAQYHDEVGVLYPLQTFSRGVDVNWKQIPIYIEASTPNALNTTRHLAEALSPRVYLADSLQRQALHLSAVLACNFTNHLWTLAEQILQRYELPTDSLDALTQETYRKAQHLSPYLGQTGPARRGDHATMERHLKLLDGQEQIQELYRLLSASIIRLYQPEG